MVKPLSPGLRILLAGSSKSKPLEQQSPSGSMPSNLHPPIGSHMCYQCRLRRTAGGTRLERLAVKFRRRNLSNGSDATHHDRKHSEKQSNTCGSASRRSCCRANSSGSGGDSSSSSSSSSSGSCCCRSKAVVEEVVAIVVVAIAKAAECQDDHDEDGKATLILCLGLVVGFTAEDTLAGA